MNVKIYRGEKIKNGNQSRIQLLKKCLRSGLPADFVNGGNPYFLQKTGYLDASIGHVANDSFFKSGYQLKHFLSFSSDKSVAQKYAGFVSEEMGIYEDQSSSLSCGSFNAEIWDNSSHVIFELDISTGKDVDSHGYGFIVHTSNTKFFVVDASKFFEIHIDRMGKYVQHIPDLTIAQANAEHDKEWLVMSIDIISPQSGVAASASGIIKQCEALKCHFFLDNDYFLSKLGK